MVSFNCQNIWGSLTNLDINFVFSWAHSKSISGPSSQKTISFGSDTTLLKCAISLLMTFLGSSRSRWLMTKVVRGSSHFSLWTPKILYHRMLGSRFPFVLGICCRSLPANYSRTLTMKFSLNLKQVLLQIFLAMLCISCLERPRSSVTMSAFSAQLTWKKLFWNISL